MCFKTTAALAAVLSLAFASGVSAQDVWQPDNPASAEFRANTTKNRTRVEALAKAAGLHGDVHFFTVNPMSEIMRLGDVYPQDGAYNSPLKIVAAQGEYEPASFQLFPLYSKKSVTFTLSDLKDKAGNTIPKSELDLKVVKIWYQNGNRWMSYFSDVGLRLCPELLLKDENMIRVDTDEVANYARIRNNGKDTYEWISAPRGLDSGFDAMQKGFADAKEMQPVTLTKNEFKQFFVTVHVPEKQAPGLYSGTITVNADGEKTVIPVKVRVLPFTLPYPRTYQQEELPIYCSAMCGDFSRAGTIAKFDDPAYGEQYFRDMLKNAKAHSMFHPAVDASPETIALLREMDFPLEIFVGPNFMSWFGRNFGGRLTFDNMMTAKANAEKARDFYAKYLPECKYILTSYGDEQGAAFVTTHRNFHKYFEQYNIRVASAGHSPLFYKGAYLFGWHMMGGAPEDTDRIKRWKDMEDKFIGFYATHHTGGENPAFIRRQNGMLGYMNGLNMIFNYEFATGPWNDLAHDLYKPMVVAYRNYGGTVDTLQWEGYREAIDDIRYATLLRQEIAKGLASKDIEYKTEARKALLFFATLQPESMDLDAARAEIIRHILNLKNMFAKTK